MRYMVVRSDLEVSWKASQLTYLRQCNYCGRVTAFNGALDIGHYMPGESELCRHKLHPVTDKVLLTAFALGGHAAVEAILRARDP